MIRHAVVLAAGRGTRLGRLVDDIPKPMLEVGGRPIIDRIIGSMVRVGIERVTVVTGHLGDVLEAHLATRWGALVGAVRQHPPRGTAHALALARDACGSEPFLLAWGDIVVADGAHGVVLEAMRAGDDAVVGVNWMEDPSAGASVSFDDDGLVSSIVEKPSGPITSNWNNAGIMALAPTIWQHVAAVRPSSRGELELTDAVAALVESGGTVRAVPLVGAWFDVGTPESLEDARGFYG